MTECKTIAALIINWNGAKDTLELITSLCGCQTPHLNIDVIIVDNKSSAADKLILKEGLSEFQGMINVKLVENNHNIGVPAAYNQCIQIIGLNYDYYLRLDNDVIIYPEGLQELVRALEADCTSSIGIVSGNVKFYHRPEIDNGGACSINIVKGVTAVSYPSQNVVCDGVLGCIMLISGVLIRRYTPEIFDPVLFICTDESELSLRAQRDGVLTLYISTIVGLHKGGVSTRKVPFLSTYFSARNWTILRFRFISGRRDVLVMITYTIFDLLKSIIRLRWAYPLGFISGSAITIATAIDGKIKGRQ